MLSKYIDEFITSPEMRDFLKRPHQSVDTIADIIYFAPASITKKKAALSELLESISDNQKLIDDCEIYLKSIDEAQRLLDSDGVFSVEIVSFDDENGRSTFDFDGLFSNYKDLNQYVKQSLEDYEIEDDEPWYYYAVKWIKDEYGKLVEACTYLIVKGEIWFVQVDKKILDDYRLDVYMMNDLNLSVPFKAGDIVEVNLYPFADKRIIVILEVGDNRDCCCLQAFSRATDGSFTIGAVKHGHIGVGAYPCISPLYTMTIYKGKMISQHEVLSTISDYISGNEERGARLSEALAAEDNLSIEKVRTIIDGLKRLHYNEKESF